MPRVRITQGFTFTSPGRAAIELQAGELFFTSDLLAMGWERRGLCQDESLPWPPLEEKRPVILGADGKPINETRE
jgi:hypothetical protein